MSRLAIVLLFSFTLSACETMSFYGQAVAGQLYILSHREDISKLIADEQTEPELKAKLQAILSIRDFAEQELHLPLKDNYSTYVDLERPFVVWNVFATPEFSMNPVSWCYPIAGCVSYRGYFAEKKAQDYAREFNDKQGKAEQLYDIYVGGVAAYSTLGWFSDSILNSLINREDYLLAGLIFHELAHQVVYIPGDTEFNESFATAVEQEGLKRWLEFTQNNGAKSDEEVSNILLAAEQNRMQRDDFVALVTEAVEELKLIYSSQILVPAMRVAKQARLAKLKTDYSTLKQSWGGYKGYDAWFSRELNNAQLSTVATYYSLVPNFQIILEKEQNDLQKFYAKVKTFEKYSPQERATALSRIGETYQ